MQAPERDEVVAQARVTYQQETGHASVVGQQVGPHYLTAATAAKLCRSNMKAHGLLEYIAETLEGGGGAPGHDPEAELVLTLPARLSRLSPASLRQSVYEHFCAFAEAFSCGRVAMCLQAEKNIVYYTVMALYLLDREGGANRRFVETRLQGYLARCRENCPGYAEFYEKREKPANRHLIAAQKAIQAQFSRLRDHWPNM